MSTIVTHIRNQRVTCKTITGNGGKIPMRSILKKAALASMVAVPLAITAPTASALAASTAPSAPAVNRVPCGHSGFLQIWGHYGGSFGHPDKDFHYCFANAGSHKMGGAWVTQISTGNNFITYHDCNGTNVDIRKHHDLSFTHSVCMGSFIIH